MKIKNTSGFKNPEQDIWWFEDWVGTIEKANCRKYQKIRVQTSLGSTQVYGINTDDDTLETLVIFPGARTSALFWDLDKGLDNLGHKLRVYLVETNGLPNLSDGKTPDIRSAGFGEWASEVLEKLNIDKAFVAGASFGGLVCMKLGLVSPEKIKAAFLLNPGCLQPFSLSPRNLFYNLLPIISPTEKNVRTFLNAAVFCKPNHRLSHASEKLIADYEVYALKHYRDNTQKPYYMGDELLSMPVDTYLAEGNKDLLFPYERSIDNAHKKVSALKEVKVFDNVGHGIETYAQAMRYIGTVIKSYGCR